MLMLVELGMQQFLNLLDSHIDRNPTLILVEHDARILNTGVCEPLGDARNSLLLGSKSIVDLFWSPMFAIVLGVRARARSCQFGL